MRRNDSEITDRKDIDGIIRRCRVCRLAMCDGSQPYIVPLSFGYDGSFLYFHTAREGRKIDIIKRNKKCNPRESSRFLASFVMANTSQGRNHNLRHYPFCHPQRSFHLIVSQHKWPYPEPFRLTLSQCHWANRGRSSKYQFRK